MNYEFLSSTKLFCGMPPEKIKNALSCLNASEKEFKKGGIIYRAGDTVTEIGLVEEGSVNITVNFYCGTSNIFGHIAKGEIFAETYAAIPNKKLICDVVAAENSKILFLDINKLINETCSSCGYHGIIIHNLLQISAEKNLKLSSRMMHTAPKTVRGRLLSYLTWQAAKNESREFHIPFTRQQLADYLGVDRSVLSTELSKMQRDGLINYRKNDIKLNNTLNSKEWL